MPTEWPAILPILAALSLVGALGAIDHPTAHGGAPPGEILFGQIVGGTAYSCRVRPEKNFWSPVELLSGATTGRGEVATTPLPFFFAHIHHDYPLRWRIAHGYLWAVQVSEPAPAQRGFELIRIPMTDLPRLAPDHENKPGDKPEPRPSADGHGPGTLSPYGVGGLDPIQSAFIQADFRDTGEVSYDFLPLSAESGRLFLRSNKLLTVYSYRFNYLKERHDYHWTWVKDGAVKLDGTGPFWAASSADDQILVIESGRILQAKLDASSVGAAKEIWSDPRPIFALVLNADPPLPFAFGRDFCFPVAVEVKPLACDAFGPDQPKPEDPLAPLRRCAKYLK